MKRLNFAMLAAGLAGLAMLMTASIASAHAPIKFIHWDSQTSPTSLTASTDNRTMKTTPNSFYLRVYDANGVRVDNGDAAVSADQLSITVTLISGLDSGAYRVDWKTTSTDGAVLTSSVPVMLPEIEGGAVPEPADDDEDSAEVPAAEAPSEAPPVVSPPSTGDGGLVGGGSGGSKTTGAMGVAGLLLATAGGLALAYRKER